MRLMFTEVFDDPATFVEELQKVPIPADLSAEFDRPAKEDVIARHVARFNPAVAGTQRSSHQHQETPAEPAGQHTME